MEKFICTYRYKNGPEWAVYHDSFYAFSGNDHEYDYCMCRSAEFLSKIDILKIERSNEK